MLHNPYKIVKMFEEEVAYYTGAPWAISTDSCTDALLLCCEYLNVKEVTIPAQTYLSVPQSIIHAFFSSCIAFLTKSFFIRLSKEIKLGWL